MSFNMATTATHTPRIVEKPSVAAGAWEQGSLLLQNASGEWAECGADPALVGGVSMHAVGTGAGALYPIGVKAFPPGRCGAIWTGNSLPFQCKYQGTLPASVGASATYGVTKGADGLWRVDFAKTGGTARVTLISIDMTASPLSHVRVYVAFLVANVQIL